MNPDENQLWRTAPDGWPVIQLQRRNDGDNPECVDHLLHLFKSAGTKASEFFLNLWNERRVYGDGNCAEVALALAVKLSCKGWEYVDGLTNFVGGYRSYHAWCEWKDWVIDFSNGRSMVVPKENYYDANQPAIEDRMNGTQLRQWLTHHAESRQVKAVA